MKILLFTHKNDIDGLGNVVLANLSFDKVEYVLCGTFNLEENILNYLNNGKIYDYDKIFITDLCLDEPLLSKVAKDEKLKAKILVFDHHKTYDNEKYTQYEFINLQIKNDKGLCCGTSLFYDYLINQGLIDEKNLVIKEFVELTRQHDTWEWKIYNNEKARELAILFDVIGCDNYISKMTKKLSNINNNVLDFGNLEKTLISNRLRQIEENLKIYSSKIIYRDILGMRAGIIFITYEYRNELAEYLRENNYDMDFVMMISFDYEVVCYRSIKDKVNISLVAEHFGGKGNNKTGSNPLSKDIQEKLVDILIK